MKVSQRWGVDGPAVGESLCPVKYAGKLREYAGKLRETEEFGGNTREDFSMPVILLCHHVGSPVYRFVLDVLQVQGHPQLQVRMWSNWHARYHATPYHGSWRMLNFNFTLVIIVLRWFATQANEGQIKLCFITLRPLEC